MSSSSEGLRRHCGTVRQTWRFYNSNQVGRFYNGNQVGYVMEEVRDGNEFFVFWLPSDEIWQGYSFQKCSIDEFNFRPQVGVIVALARGIGTENGLWLVTEDVGVDSSFYPRWWMIYQLRRGRMSLKLIIKMIEDE